MKTNFILITAVVFVYSVAGTGAIAQDITDELFRGFKDYEDSYLVCGKAVGEESGIRMLDVATPRPKGNRQSVYPVGGSELMTNPPLFTWPMADYEFPTTFPPEIHEKELSGFAVYDFQLGRTRDFSDKSSEMHRGLHMAFYNHHKPLSPGKWYWRYRVSGQKWSEVYEVTVPENLQKFESPEPDEAWKMLPAGHPRIFTGMEKGRSLTEDQEFLVSQFKRRAKNALVKNPSDYAVKGEPIPETASEQERVQIMRFRLSYEFGALNEDISNLLFAYVATSDRQYLDKAVILGDYVSRQEPKDMYRKSDFTGIKSMSTLAQIYDMAYEDLSEEQKERYENFIGELMPLVISHTIQENVGSGDGIISAHFFQKTFYGMFCTAVIMKNHIPQAETWFDILYPIWLSRAPGGGFLYDGVWPNGNIGYVHVNMESMVDVYLLYRQLFGIDTFSHPWYRNCAEALAYVLPANSAGDGFGDGCEKIHGNNDVRAAFAYILGQETGNPFALYYAAQLSGQEPGQPFKFRKTAFANYRLQHRPKTISATFDKASVPQSAVFPETGIVVMHTDVLDSKDNLFVSFRSSPFGVGSHGLAEQNSFNIIYKGVPVFYPTGYRVTTQDKHYLLCQKHSRARNTVLADGKTQAFSHSGYGWIARYLDGEGITYTMGDASRAYVQFDKSAINWITVLKNADSYKSEEGFILTGDDDPKVKKFRRHVARLRPNIVVVYDELEADKDITWTFQLNGLQGSSMKLGTDVKNTVTADTEVCDAQAAVFASSGLRTSLADTSYVRPFDWLNPQRGRKPIAFEDNQYHAAFENADKCKKMRFLSVIQIDSTDSMNFTPIIPDDNGMIHAGGYIIKAELDTGKEARLEIEHKSTGEYLLYGPTEGSVKAGGRSYSHSTVLVEPDGKMKESIDVWPSVVKLSEPVKYMN